MRNDPKQDKAKRKNSKIYREEIKDRHTSHWDLDMLSHKQLEELMTAHKPSADEGS